LHDRRYHKRVSRAQSVICLIVVEKMHLWPLDFEGENSIVALQ
jgi:hypothetical protein